MAHTPGPWTYRMRPPIEPGAIRDYADIDSEQGSPVTVASFYGEDEDNEADARLIAAAPELLEAVRDLLDFAERGDDDRAHERKQAARAAIAKATGEQP